MPYGQILLWDFSKFSSSVLSSLSLLGPTRSGLDGADLAGLRCRPGLVRNRTRKAPPTRRLQLAETSSRTPVSASDSHGPAEYLPQHQQGPLGRGLILVLSVSEQGAGRTTNAVKVRGASCSCSEACAVTLDFRWGLNAATSTTPDVPTRRRAKDAQFQLAAFPPSAAQKAQSIGV